MAEKTKKKTAQTSGTISRKEMFRKIVSYYKPHKGMFGLDMLCSFLVAVCDLFYPQIAKNIINDYVYRDTTRFIIVWALAMLAIYLIKAGLNFYIQYWGHVVGVYIQGDMRRDLFRHIQKLPFKYFDENKTGTIMSRLVNDLMEITELAHHGGLGDDYVNVRPTVLDFLDVLVQTYVVGTCFFGSCLCVGSAHYQHAYLLTGSVRQ